MSNTTEQAISKFDEKEFVQRHKFEAHNMFELVEHMLGHRVSFNFALDVGGGYGDHLPFVQDRISTIIAADIIQYLSDKDFSPQDVASRSAKYGGHLDLNKVSFHYCDAQQLIYRNDLFDFVFSINAFEHIPNPLLAFSEILRVARAGAPIYIQFDPIWNSPWGHHLPHLRLEPWDHLLHDEIEFSKLILQRGGTDNDISIYKNAMSRKSFSYYRRIFQEDFLGKFSKQSFVSWSSDPADEPATLHPNFQRCIAKGYDVEELVTRGVQFFGIKI